MKKTVPGLSALALGVVGIVAFAPAASAATCVPSPGSPAIPAVYDNVLVTPGTPGSPAVTHNETRYTRTVVDVPGSPEIPAVTEVQTKTSKSSFIKGWTQVSSEFIVTTPGVPAQPEVSHDEFVFERTVIDQPYVPAVPDRTETRLVSEAWDETVVVTPAWDEEVLVTPAQPAIPAVTHVEYLYRHWITGKEKWSAVPLGWGWEEVDCRTVVDVPAVPAVPAVYKTVHHDAVTQVVHHDAVYEDVLIPGTPEVPEVSHVENSGWVLTAPEGDGWIQIDKRTVVDQEAVPAVEEEGYTLYTHQREVIVTPAIPAVEEVSHEESIWVPEEEDAPEGYVATEDVQTVVDEPAIEGTEDVWEDVLVSEAVAATPAVVCQVDTVTNTVTVVDKTDAPKTDVEASDESADTLAHTGADPALGVVAGLALLAAGGTLVVAARRRNARNEG